MRSTIKLMYYMFQYNRVLFCFFVVENKRIPDSWGYCFGLFSLQIEKFSLDSTITTDVYFKRTQYSHGISMQKYDIARVLVDRMYIQCGAVITRSIFTQILTKDTLSLAREGKVWGVLCEHYLWCIFCLSHCRTTCKIMLCVGPRYNGTRLYIYIYIYTYIYKDPCFVGSFCHQQRSYGLFGTNVCLPSMREPFYRQYHRAPRI